MVAKIIKEVPLPPKRPATPIYKPLPVPPPPAPPGPDIHPILVSIPMPVTTGVPTPTQVGHPPAPQTPNSTTVTTPPVVLLPPTQVVTTNLPTPGQIAIHPSAPLPPTPAPPIATPPPVVMMPPTPAPTPSPGPASHVSTTIITGITPPPPPTPTPTPMPPTPAPVSTQTQASTATTTVTTATTVGGLPQVQFDASGQAVNSQSADMTAPTSVSASMPTDNPPGHKMDLMIELWKRYGATREEAEYQARNGAMPSHGWGDLNPGEATVAKGMGLSPWEYRAWQWLGDFHVQKAADDAKKAADAAATAKPPTPMPPTPLPTLPHTTPLPLPVKSSMNTALLVVGAGLGIYLISKLA